MAFEWQRLNKHADFSGHKMFHYITPDSHTAVFTNGYFNDAVTTSNLEDGDVILAVCSADGTKTLRQYVCTVNPTTKAVSTTQMTTAA